MLKLFAVRKALATKTSIGNSIDHASRIHSVPTDTRADHQPSPVAQFDRSCVMHRNPNGNNGTLATCDMVKLLESPEHVIDLRSSLIWISQPPTVIDMWIKFGCLKFVVPS